LKLGANTSGHFVNGSVDNVSIWNTTLSNSEIQQYINCPPTGNEEGLAGYWNFAQGSGTTAFDQTVNGNDGMVNGATWSTETPESSCSFCSSSDEISVTINVCGCTDSEAVNYNLEANEDDSSCCYDIDYVNDANNQSYNDGYSDGEESVICPENICPADLDGNGYVSTSDLLIFLNDFGQYCDVLDECGVINGDGSTCSDQCGEPFSHEGYDYATVQIGVQCWFSENCRYLPEVSPSSEGSETDSHYYVYDYQGTDVEAAMSTENYETYGVLYNWSAVMTEGICPSGWHVASDGDWQTMEISLGMDLSEVSESGWRGTDQGYQLKSTSLWNPNENGSNSSGFNGLPGGIKDSWNFTTIGYDGAWWSTSNLDSWTRRLQYDFNGVYRFNNDISFGFSARCIKD
jgi:uncharacterized protein (TIGR02145 family)